MAGVTPFFNNFFSAIFLLLLHLGCFSIPTKYRHPRPKVSKPSRFNCKPGNLISSSWTLVKHLVSAKTCTQTHPELATSIPSQQSIATLIQSEQLVSHPPRHIRSGSCPESDITADNPFFPLRNDIFPCTACGEIFQRPQLLEQHQVVKHAVTELVDGDSGNNIVRIIFKTGWTDSNRSPDIHRILKIHNSPKTLSRFEEYRESVKSKAARNGAVRRSDERCIADGNELLRFSCTTFTCELGLNGDSNLCNQQYCSVCGIIKQGFSTKIDGILTVSTSLKAHMSIPDDMEKEFKFMNVKRAMLICRVVAGQVGSDSNFDDVDKKDGAFDSVVTRDSFSGGAHTRMEDDDELLVFNPRAVLPCFVIVYTA